MKLFKVVGAYVSKLIYEVFAKYLPVSNSWLNIGQKKIRNFLARHFAQNIAKTANIERGAQFSRRVTVGHESGIGIRAYIQGETHIGDYVMMGPDCNIWTINHNMSQLDIPMCKQGVQKEKPVYIGDDVWIGSRVTILPGCHIGNGAVIGAGSVVTRDVPDYAIAAGNPVRVIRYRYE